MGSLNPIWLVFASLALAMIPFFLGAATSYIKISIVLGLLRGGFGTQGAPGATVVAALALSLTMFVMAPTWNASMEAASHVSFGEIAQSPSRESLEKLQPILEPWKKFMHSHSGDRELLAVAELESSQKASDQAVTAQPPSWRRVLLAFVLTELRQAFSMGFVLLLPFLVIDVVIANILVGLGMFMVSPTLLSLPLKLLLFLACDGWLLITRGLIHSYS